MRVIKFYHKKERKKWENNFSSGKKICKSLRDVHHLDPHQS